MKNKIICYRTIQTLLFIFILGLSNNYAQSLNTKKNMSKEELKTEEGLKATLQKLINPSDSFGRKELELIYHNEMLVIILDDQGNKSEFKKPEFVELIGTKLDKREEHKNNKWAKFHHVSIKDNNGHIIVERKLNLTGTKTKLIVNIDFVWQDERWQITREVIYSMNLTESD